MQIFKLLQSFVGINAKAIHNEVEVQSGEIDVTQFNVSIQKFDWLEFFEPEIFRNWTEELKNSLTRKEKDLWSLTGKAVLIQSSEESEIFDLLQKVASDAKMNLARVPADQVASLLPNARQKFQKLSPAIVMLDPGSWMSEDVELGISSSSSDTQVCSLFAKDLKEFDCDFPVVFVVCVKSYDDVSKNLLKVDAFDRIFAHESPSADFLGNRFLKLFDPNFLDETIRNSVKKVGLLLQSEYESRSEQELLALRLKRLANHESRTINFNDLTDFALRGLQEQNRLKPIKVDSEVRRKTAYHEAGHACISIIASNGENVPDYASIVPSKNFEGVVFESLAYYDNLDEITYKFLLLKTRIALAGRAAEELFFGGLNISSGANSDLSSATRMCFRLFAYSGFHSKMDGQAISASNLAVLNLGEVDPLQYERVSKDVRNFLEDQYLYVMNTLKEKRAFVDAVAQRLLWDPVVDQEEMKILSEQHGIPIAK
jgi:hypothetical protein